MYKSTDMYIHHMYKCAPLTHPQVCHVYIYIKMYKYVSIFLSSGLFRSLFDQNTYNHTKMHVSQVFFAGFFPYVFGSFDILANHNAGICLWGGYD